MSHLSLRIDQRNVCIELDSIELTYQGGSHIYKSSDNSYSSSDLCTYVEARILLDGKDSITFDCQNCINARNKNNDFGCITLYRGNEDKKRLRYGDDKLFDEICQVLHCVIKPNSHMPVAWIEKVAQEFIDIIEATH